MAAKAERFHLGGAGRGWGTKGAPPSSSSTKGPPDSTAPAGAFFGSTPATGAPTPLNNSPGGWQLAPILIQSTTSGAPGVNCTLALYAHSFDITGLQIAMCDGSVHTIQGSMSNTTWNIAMQPNDGLPMGSDWVLD